ncbi:hypothetical protein ACH3O9_11395 [Leeuwenhoekiella sp. A16]|uniref:hypothetical protein n=1 Tax=Leeuwenhoekiella sp. A16 TaxID=3141462 RepID=UPI003A8103EC
MIIYQTTDYIYHKEKITKKVKHYKCLDSQIEQFFKDHPNHDEICAASQPIRQGTNISIFKKRLPNSTMNKGTRGGYRIIFLSNKKSGNIILLSVYPKIGPKKKTDLEIGELEKLIKNSFQEIANKTLVEY